MLKQNIDLLMGSPSAKAVSSNDGGDGAFNDDGGGGGGGTDGDEGPILFGSVRDDLLAESKNINNTHSEWTECKDEKGNVYYYNSSTKESSWSLPSSSSSSSSSSANNNGSRSDMKGKGISEGNGSSYLDDLKALHLSSITKLTDKLNQEKSKRMRSLEERLMHRQQVRKKKGGAEYDDVSVDQEIEREIEQTSKQMDSLTSTIISGYKKKCLYELKAAKAKGSGPLSEEDKEDAIRQAADALKQRYVRDQQSLLETLEGERNRQKERLLKAMDKKRRGLFTPQEVADHDEQVRLELMKLDRSFENQESGALSDPQNAFLLTLAALNIDDSILTEKTSNSDKHDEEDEDGDYLSDAKSHHPHDDKASTWIQGISNLSKTYEAAGDQLRKKISEAQRLAGTGDNDSDHPLSSSSSSGFQEITAHMLGVIADAFNHQVAFFYFCLIKIYLYKYKSYLYMYIYLYNKSYYMKYEIL
jgi:hypothetical protein